MATLEKMLEGLGEALAEKVISHLSGTLHRRIPEVAEAAVPKLNGTTRALKAAPNKLTGKPVHRDFSCRAPGCKNKAGPRNGYYCVELHKKLHKKPKK